ncbi:MAG TPA: ABC transporter substrate-binding protein [Thermodesulfovibrionales bacterium]|nr:ABC transporter substrate-binding protein [Thermodesulfovibrionales bacterium]
MLKGIKKALGFLSMALLILSLAPTGGVEAEMPAKIKVGLMFGLTGAASPIGPVQLEGAKLAIKEVNAAGGVKIGGKKVPVEFVVKDDETKPDVAIRRFREMTSEDKVDILVGQTFAPISAAINKEVKKTLIAYFPVNVVAITMFEKNEMAETTFAIHGAAYSIGYAGASYIADKMRLKNIVFFAPAYAFGRDQWAGAKAAFDKRGIKVEYLESPVGTSDYTSYLLKIAEMKPDIVMMAHWGVDAINVLKQTYETGLKKKTKIWFDWMTNAFGSGVPPEALEGVYSLMSWYYDMKGFEDAAIVKAAEGFTKKFMDEYKYPPDPYAAMAYIGTREAIRGIELAQSTDPSAIAKALMGNPKFDSMKGPGTWRVDHEPLFKYGAFVVVGKGEKERKDKKWDLVKILGAYTGEDYLPSLKGLGY